MRSNWAGTHEYTAARIVAATGVDDIRRAVAAGGPVHALGTRHSFTDLPDTEGTLIDVSGLEHPIELDEAAATVSVGAGTRYGELAVRLEERGWALHNLGSLPHISVGGAMATGTHGSGDGNGVLSTAVRELRYVGADASEHTARRGDPDFATLAVGLGAFGVVTALTLDIRPTFRLRQDVYAGLSWEAFLARVPAVTGAGYSVSVFTQWDPEDLGWLWIKTRLGDDRDDVADVILDGRRVAQGALPLGAEAAPNLTQLDGVPGPWLERLPHFRLDRRPSFGEEIQSEYFIDRADAADALRAVRALGSRIRPVLLVSELRTAAADELELSPASGRDVVAIHFTWRRDPVGVRAVLRDIEAALVPFAARPHWGKLHLFDRAAIERVHPRLAQAREVFDRLDPDGRFANAHLRRLGVRV